jgi:oxygen-independent coproporphyrinogen III oxidase
LIQIKAVEARPPPNHGVMQRPDLHAIYERRLPRYTSYPTAPAFHPGITDEVYRSWLQTIARGTKASLYLHVPFCEAMCWYCGCHTTVAKSYSPVAGYAALLAREIALVADLIPARLAVTHVHWGGGTPNLLSSEDLRHVFAAIEARFDLAPEAEIAIELDPRTLDRGKTAVLAACGVNRASLGVQDIDPRVQEAVNRRQPYETTAAAFDTLRRHGIARINADLMYGLPYQTAAGVAGTAARIASLAPDRIALFGYAHVPWMKPHQRLIPEAALPDTAARLAQYDSAGDAIAAAGYRRIGIDHFARPQDSLARAAEAGTLHRNFQGYTADDAPLLLGFGASAIGSLPQGYVQNDATIAGWRQSIAAGRLATARGVALDDSDRLRRAVIERLMCDLAVDLAQECARHGADPAAFAAECAAVDALAERGLGWRDGWRLGVAARDRALVRALCAVFDAYLPDSAARHSRVV